MKDLQSKQFRRRQETVAFEKAFDGTPDCAKVPHATS